MHYRRQEEGGQGGHPASIPTPIANGIRTQMVGPKFLALETVSPHACATTVVHAHNLAPCTTKVALKGPQQVRCDGIGFLWTRQRSVGMHRNPSSLHLPPQPQGLLTPVSCLASLLQGSCHSASEIDCRLGFTRFEVGASLNPFEIPRQSGLNPNSLPRQPAS